MRWPFGRRGRHAAGRVVFIGGDPYPPARVPAVPPVAPPPPPRAPVRLGFADGSEVALAADDPAALALREVADLLAVRRDGPEGSRPSGQAGSFS